MSMPAYRPTHFVAAGGLPAWSTPDATQPTAGRLDPGLQVQVVQWWGQWANVQCSNGWTAWVDGTALGPLGQPAGTPSSAPAPAPTAAAASRTSASSYSQPLGLLAAALVLAGPFFPWLSLEGLTDFNAFHIPVAFLWSIDSQVEVDAQAVSVGGLVAVLAIGIAGLTLAKRPKPRRLLGSVSAGVCAVYGSQLLRSLNESPDAPGIFSVLGFGVYVSLIGAVIALAVRR